jgi:hypothetical protein
MQDDRTKSGDQSPSPYDLAAEVEARMQRAGPGGEAVTLLGADYRGLEALCDLEREEGEHELAGWTNVRLTAEAFAQRKQGRATVGHLLATAVRELNRLGWHAPQGEKE